MEKAPSGAFFCGRFLHAVLFKTEVLWRRHLRVLFLWSFLACRIVQIGICSDVFVKNINRIDRYLLV